MVSVDKFFVYGGGRWREVDTGSGRIDGWGRAKFLVSRGGKLQAIRSRPVRSALRKLADNKTSAAKAGLRLPEKITQRLVSRERDARVGCTHCRCCHHISTGSSSSTKPAENKASVAIQCDELEPALDPLPRLQDPLPLLRDTSKRKRDSTSPENLPQTKVLTVATVHSPRKPEPKRRSTTSSNKSPKKVGSKRKRQISSSSDDSRALVTLKRSRRSPSVKLRRPGPLKRKRRSSTEQTSPILQSKISLEKRRDKPKHKKVRQDETSADDRLRRTTRQRPSIVISSDESDSEPNIKSPTPSKSKTQQSSSTDKNKPGLRRARAQSSTDQSQHKIGPKRTKEKTSINEPLKHKVGPKKASEPSSGNPQNSGHAVVGRSQLEAPKELMIDEQDVHILRLFLQKHYPDEDLLRFDTDDKYKMLHFYQINPLVCVERCPRVAAAATKRGLLSLIDFASKLGLRSVSEPSSTKPERCRRREGQSGGGADESGSEHAGAEDKENIDRLLTRRKGGTKKVLRESLKRNKPVVVREHRESDTRRGDDTVALRSENETENVKGVKIANVIEPQSKKAKPKTSKRSGLNEYSNLEDHAIVAWVSEGGRACSVNGNRLWRQLEEQFQRITGRGRTWHSLRNRYLRYILPGLDGLALPHAQQTRLRAAAATGELKARRKQPRRNSIFTLPPRGASSRRRAASPGRISDEEPAREQRKPGAGLQDNAGSPLTRALAPRAAPSSYADVTRQPPERPHRAPGPPPANKPASETSRKQSVSPRRTSSRTSSRTASRTSSPRESNRSNSSSESSGESLKNKRRRSPREHKSTDSRSDDSLSMELSRRRSSRLNLPGEANRRRSNRHNSPSEPNRRRSSRLNLPGEANRRRSNRHNSPSEPNRRRSSRHNNSPSEPNRRSSNRHNSPSEPNRRRSNRHNSPTELNRRRSNRHNNSPSEPNRRRSNGHNNSPSEPNRRSSNRHNSPSEPNRRRSNRHNSPSEPYRRRSNRHNNSPSEPNRRSSNRHNSPTELNRRRSNRHNNSPSEPNRRRSNRHKSPSEPNNRRVLTCRTSSPSERKSNRNKSSSESSRHSSPRGSSHGHTSPESSRRPPTPDRQLRKRKLFNPATVL